jgi:hypothetical protein
MDGMIRIPTEAICFHFHHDQTGSSVEEAAENLFFFGVVYLATLYSIEAIQRRVK